MDELYKIRNVQWKSYKRFGSFCIEASDVVVNIAIE